jgi:hypothetical protein
MSLLLSPARKTPGVLLHVRAVTLLSIKTA